jgi:hypothetical protein
MAPAATSELRRFFIRVFLCRESRPVAHCAVSPLNASDRFSIGFEWMGFSLDGRGRGYVVTADMKENDRRDLPD